MHLKKILGLLISSTIIYGAHEIDFTRKSAINDFREHLLINVPIKEHELETQRNRDVGQVYSNPDVQQLRQGLERSSISMVSVIMTLANNRNSTMEINEILEAIKEFWQSDNPLRRLATLLTIEDVVLDMVRVSKERRHTLDKRADRLDLCYKVIGPLRSDVREEIADAARRISLDFVRLECGSLYYATIPYYDVVPTTTS